jgi:hypothetical protein
MLRTVLTDEMWNQILTTMKSKGCYETKDGRDVMEAIIWKLRTGSPWRDIPEELCPWQTAYNRFNRWSKKDLWADFFLNYEAKLMKNGFSSTEVTLKLISMRVELGLVKIEQLESLVGEQQLRFILPPTRMETRLILKSLGVKFTMPRSQKS